MAIRGKNTDSIRVSNSSKKIIEVNDRHDTIVLDFDNMEFYNKAISIEDTLTEKFSAVAKKYAKKDTDDIKVALSLNKDISLAAIDVIDDIFGADTCKKVFGENVVPGLKSIREFIDAITPYIEDGIKDINKGYMELFSTTALQRVGDRPSGDRK